MFRMNHPHAGFCPSWPPRMGTCPVTLLALCIRVITKVVPLNPPKNHFLWLFFAFFASHSPRTLR